MARPSGRRAGARGGSAGRSTRRSSSSRSGGNQQLLWIGGVVAVVAIVVVVFATAGRGGATPGDGASKPAAAPPADPPRAATPAPKAPSGTARGGKTPDRPAPPIADADLDRAHELYRVGVDKWNEAQRARGVGDTSAYAAALDEAFEALSAQRDALREYTDWFEEADLEGWAMPAEYDALQRRLDQYDPTYQKVKKLKQAH